MSNRAVLSRLSARAHVEAVAIMGAMRGLIEALAPYETEPPDAVKAADVWLRENHPAPAVYIAAMKEAVDA